MTKSVLVLPSDLYKEADRAKQLEKELADKNNELAENKIILQEKDSENNRLRQKLIEAGINPDE